MKNFSIPQLNEGELWAGILVGKNGEPDLHVILLPGKHKDNWEKCMSWAKKIGGKLPNRRMQSLLITNLKEEFEANWYWSSEQHESDSYGAWGQYFGFGSQNTWGKDGEGLARAVRTISIE